MPPKLPPKRPPFVPSPPRKAAAPLPPPITLDTERCVACQGSGTSSRGKTCVPCGGSGRTQVKRPAPKPPHRQRELLPVVDLVYGCPGTPSTVIAVLALDTFVDHGIRLFKSKDDAITWMVSQLIEHKEIARNDDGTYHHEGDDYINPEEVLEAWQHRAEPSEYFEIIPIR